MVAPTIVTQSPADTLTCEPPAGPARPVRLAAGQYRLVVVPTRRWQWPAGRREAVAGGLWLWPASPGDRPPATGERAVAPPAALGTSAFVGATDADLPRAGVYLDTTPRLFPPPTSRDPVYPGLFVGRAPPPERGWTLLVGVQNRRARQRVRVRDGPGAYFAIATGDGRGGFAGRWGPYGRVGSAGHFCARYVGPAPQR